MAFCRNVIVLYTIGKLFLSSIQWWYFYHSHKSSDSVIIIIILILIIIIISFCLCVLYVITARHNVCMYFSKTNEVLNDGNNVLSYNCTVVT